MQLCFFIENTKNYISLLVNTKNYVLFIGLAVINL